MQKERIEQLAILQALQKVIGEQVDTRNPDGLRAEFDDHCRALYEATGSKSFDVTIGDEIVGSYSIRFSKPKPSECYQTFEVSDYEELAKWFDACEVGMVKDFAASQLANFANFVFTETGEVPNGCALTDHVTAEITKSYIGGALKVEPEKVANALHGSLPQRIVGLLGGE